MEKPIDRRNVVTIGAVFDVLEPYRQLFGEGLYQQIRRGLTRNFSMPAAVLQLRYEGIRDNQNAAQEYQAFLKRLERAYCK